MPEIINFGKLSDCMHKLIHIEVFVHLKKNEGGEQYLLNIQKLGEEREREEENWKGKNKMPVQKGNMFFEKGNTFSKENNKNMGRSRSISQ